VGGDHKLVAAAGEVRAHEGHALGFEVRLLLDLAQRGVFRTPALLDETGDHGPAQGLVTVLAGVDDLAVVRCREHEDDRHGRVIPAPAAGRTFLVAAAVRAGVVIEGPAEFGSVLHNGTVRGAFCRRQADGNAGAGRPAPD